MNDQGEADLKMGSKYFIITQSWESWWSEVQHSCLRYLKPRWRLVVKSENGRRLFLMLWISETRTLNLSIVMFLKVLYSRQSFHYFSLMTSSILFHRHSILMLIISPYFLLLFILKWVSLNSKKKRVIKRNFFEHFNKINLFIQELENSPTQK